MDDLRLVASYQSASKPSNVQGPFGIGFAINFSFSKTKKVENRRNMCLV